MPANACCRYLTLATLAALAAGCAAGPSATGHEDQVGAELLAAFDGLDADQITAAGDAAAAAGDYDRALFMYMQAAELDESPAIWHRIGNAYRQSGNRPGAWQAYNRALQLDPGHAATHEEMGLLYLSMKQRDPAASHLARAIETDPTRWRAHNALGIIADVEKDYGRAIGHYNAALEVRPESALLLNNLGYSHYLAGNLTIAEQHFRMAVGVDPEYAPARANLGLMHARRRDYDEALAILSRVLGRAQAHNDVGFIAYNNGDLEEAEWLLTEAIRLSPAYDETARQNLRRVRQALADSRPADTANNQPAENNNDLRVQPAMEPPT